MVPVLRTCRTCPKRSTCKEICRSLERRLPRLRAQSRARLSVLDREFAWSVQDREDEFPEPLRTVARMYFRFGLSEREVAEALAINVSSVCRFLARIRAAIRKTAKKRVWVEGVIDSDPSDGR